MSEKFECLPARQNVELRAEGVEFSPAVLTERQQQIVDAEVEAGIDHIITRLDPPYTEPIGEKVTRVIQFGSSVYSRQKGAERSSFRLREDSAEAPSDIDLLAIADMPEEDFAAGIRQRRDNQQTQWSSGRDPVLCRALTKIPSRTGEVKDIEIKIITTNGAEALQSGHGNPNIDIHQTLCEALAYGTIVYEK